MKITMSPLICTDSWPLTSKLGSLSEAPVAQNSEIDDFLRFLLSNLVQFPLIHFLSSVYFCFYTSV